MCQNNQPTHQSFPTRLVQQPVCHASLKCDSPDIVKPSELNVGKPDKMLQKMTFLIFAKQACFMNIKHFAVVQGKLQLTTCTGHLGLLENFPSKKQANNTLEGQKSGCIRKYFEFGIKWNLRQNQHSRHILNHSLCSLCNRRSAQSQCHEWFHQVLLHSPHPQGQLCSQSETVTAPLPVPAEVLVLFLAEAFQEAVSLLSLSAWA